MNSKCPQTVRVVNEVHLTVWLSWIHTCGSLVYSRIIPFSFCYIISQVTWSWWHHSSSMLFQPQNKMEVGLWLQARLTHSRLLYVWPHSFVRMGIESSSYSLMKGLFVHSISYIYLRNISLTVKKKQPTWHTFFCCLHDHNQLVYTIMGLD